MRGISVSPRAYQLHIHQDKARPLARDAGPGRKELGQEVRLPRSAALEARHLAGAGPQALDVNLDGRLGVQRNKRDHTLHSVTQSKGPFPLRGVSRRPQLWNSTGCSAFANPHNAEELMAKKVKSARGRKQDRALVAGKQRYEVSYVAKKSKTSAKAVKKAVKKAGPGRKKVMKALRG